jgi:Protein of unknown function (DUF4236)/Bacterial SH3 domain
MGYFRFRRSIKIAPGVRWNIGKKGSSLSFGGRGFTYTVGPQGSRTTVGIPGTGMSYTQVHSQSKGTSSVPPSPTSASMAQKSTRSNRSTFLYICGFILLGIWLLGKVSEQGNRASSTSSSPSAPLPSNSASTLTPRAYTSAATVSTTLPPRPTYSPPASYSPSPVRRAIPVEPSASAAPSLATAPQINVSPPLSHYVMLTKSVSIRRPSGITSVLSPGTEVTFVSQEGNSVVIRWAGVECKIPISWTDLRAVSSEQTPKPKEDQLQVTNPETNKDATTARAPTSWPTATPQVRTYHLVNVTDRNPLNMRQGPGADYPIIGQLHPTAHGIILTTKRMRNGTTTWQEISVNGYSGWVNQIYLVPDLP